MVTIFACPKPFRGHIEVIQRNAVISWTLLKPTPEIILFGNEPGTAEICEEFGLRHVGEVECNEFGTPLVNDLFEKAKQLGSYDLLCYVNGDIILMSYFVGAVTKVSQWRTPFLMGGRRWDIDISDPWDFGHNWENKLCHLVAERGRLRTADWIDYCVFSRHTWAEMPPLAIGRVWWDNWLIWKARSAKIPVVDVSPMTLAVHQNHDYSHHPDGKQGVWNGEEARRNYELAGGWTHCYTLEDASHRLTPAGIRRNLSSRYFLRRLEMARRWSIERTRPLRRRLGLTRSASA